MQLALDVFTQCLSVPASTFLKTAWEKQSNEILYDEMVKGYADTFQKSSWGLSETETFFGGVSAPYWHWIYISCTTKYFILSQSCSWYTGWLQVPKTP